MKIKAAYFYDSKSLGRHWSLDLDNQAFSGTDFILLQVFLGLKSREENVLLLSTSLPLSPNSSVQKIDDIVDAYNYCLKFSISYLIFNVKPDENQYRLFSKAKIGHTKLIGWAQNTPEFAWLSAAWRCASFCKLIAVSNFQRIELAHHPLFNKTIVIPNFINDKVIELGKHNVAKAEAVISYVGALKVDKGFQHLAAAWPQVKKRFPQAILNVCGSPGLYRSNSVLGSEGIAEEHFEKEILSYLGQTREAARKLGVYFLGSVPKDELYKIVQSSTAVVVNPNVKGSTETFCVSAAEAMALNVPVVGGAAGGLIEIIGNKVSGLLVRNNNELEEALITLLSNLDYASKLAKRGRERIQLYFNQTIAISRWQTLLNDENITPDTHSDISLKNLPYYSKSILRTVLPLNSIETVRRIKQTLK